MGRKIPGRKHHGVRDPEKQQAQRFKLIKNKINAPPTNPDDQQVPHSLKRLKELRDKVKTGDLKRKKVNTPKPQMFTKNVKETDRQFLHRINGMCDQVKREAGFEEKYNVQVKRDDSGDVIDVVKRPTDPIRQMLKEAKRDKKKKKGTVDSNEPRLTKSQKRTKKITEKKRRKQQLKNEDLGEQQMDRVEFGEQVHAPPTLTIPRKVAKNPNAPRPGTKDLLLKTLIGNSKGPTGGVSNKTIDRKGKRKDLPNALRRQLEKQQAEVIQAYKAMKVNKN